MSEMIQKKRRATEKLVQRTKTLTTEIYQRVKEEYLTSKGRWDNSQQGFAKRIAYMINSDLSPEEQDEVSELYKEELTKLPSKDLEEILIAHNAGKYRRRADTLHVVEMELARRGILGDSNEKK